MTIEFNNQDEDVLTFAQAEAPGNTEPVSLRDAVGPPMPLEQVAKSRAIKNDLGMGNTSPGYKQLYDSLQRGEESRLRESQAYRENLRQQENRLEVFRTISANRDTPLTNEEMKDVSDVANFWGVKVTPALVSERLYSRELMKNAFQADMVKNITEGWEKANPELLSMGFNVGQGVLARREVLTSTYEDALARAKDQGYASLGLDLAKTLTLGFVGLDWTPYANIIPGKTFTGTPGGILQQQVAYLHTLPLPEMKETVDGVLSRLNPGEAMVFSKALLEWNNNDSTTTNFWAVFGPASIAATLPLKALPKPTPSSYFPKDMPPMLSDVEKKIMGLRASPVTSDFSRPFFDEFKIISDVEKEMLKRSSSPMNADNIVIPGTIQSMERPRPMSTYEVFQATRAMASGKPLGQPELIGYENAWREVSTVIKDIVKAAEDSPPRIEKILSAAGDTKGAARATLARSPLMNEETFKESMQGILRGDKFVEDATSFSREATTRLNNLWTSQATKLLDALASHAKFDRIPPEAMEAAFLATEQLMKRRMPPSVSNSVVNVIRNPGLDNVANVPSMTLVMGRSDGTPFTSWDAANYAAVVRFKLGLGNFKIVQHGAGKYVTYTKTLDETIDDVRNVIVNTPSEKAKSNWTHMFKWWNTAAPYTLPESNMEARHITLHGTQMLQNVNKQVASSIGALKKGERKNMQLLFDKDRAYEQDGKIGRFAANLGEFEQNYLSEFNRMPSEREAAAYFSFRNLNNFDYVSRNLGLYKDLSRQGVENFRFKLPNKAYTDYIWGKEVTELPLANDRAAGVYVADGPFAGQYFRTSQMPDDVRTFLKDAFKKGETRAYQISNPLERPLSEVASSRGDYINFVVSKQFQSRPVDAFSIPYHDGFHKEYAASHYVKQAIISPTGGRKNYEGDITILGAMSQAEAQVYQKALTQATMLYKQGKVDELKDFLAKNLPEEHFSYKDFVRRFEGEGQRWSIDEPFTVVPSGRTINQMDKSMEKRYGALFSDEHNSPYNMMRDVDKRFLGSRDPSLWAIKELGSEQQPLYAIESSPMIDIMQSLNRTVSSATHNRLIQDYKLKSAEQFIENFADVMNVPLADLRRNPMYYLQNANSHWNSTALTSPMIATGKASRANILQFIGMDSPDIRGIKWLQSQVTDMVYKTAGQAPSHWVSDHAIGGIQDPTVYAKRIATHLNLGMFNPLQVVNQIQSVVHSWALAGTTGLKGTMGAAAMVRLEMTENPAIIKWYDQKLAASNVGWKPGWLEESRREMKRSGFSLVQGETSWRDDIRDVNMVQTWAGKFAEAGLVFFKMGERGGRMTAWNTAFLESKASNPNAVIDDREMGKILARASQLNNDMTKAAQAPVEQGLWTIPTQFWQYQLRMFGQLNPFSPRTTAVEKARAYAVYGALFGIPVASNISVPTWPVYESIRQYALENDKAWGPGTLSYALMEGLPSYLASMITGRDSAQKYGPQGIQAFRELYHSDQGMGDFAKFLTGASGSKVKDIMKPLASSFYSVYKGITEGNPKFWDSQEWPMVAKDWQDTAYTIGSVGQAFRAYYAFNLKSYYTRNGRLVADDMDKLDAAIMTATGMTPRRVSDSFLMLDSLAMQSKVQKAAEKEIKNEMRAAFDAMRQGDDDAYKRHVSRARTHFIGAGFDEMQWGKVMMSAGKELMPQAKSIPEDFKIWRAPRARKEEYLKGIQQ